MLIEILCKLVRLIFRDPIGVNVKLYHEIIGEKNLRKEGLIWTNWKVLDLIEWLWKVGGTNVQLSLKLFLTENSAALPFFLFLRFVSWVFRLVLHVLWEDCWWDSFKSWEIFYCHEIMFVWYGISRIWGYLLVNVKE